MKTITDTLLPIALPVAALLSAASLLVTRSASSVKPEPRTAAPAELLEIVRGKRKFAQEDIQLVVRAMHRAGIDNFVCRINPDSGDVNVTTNTEETAHLDVKPGSCPNPLRIRGGGAFATFPTGVLGNAFDVTDVDLGSIRLRRGEPLAWMTEAEVVPNHITFLDVGTPFEGGPCECAAFGPDGLLDLSVQYNNQDVIDALGLAAETHGATVPLQVVGLFQGGEVIFAATDCVKINKR